MANASGNNEIKGVTLVIVALLCAGAFALAIRLNERLEAARAQVAALERRETDGERLARMRTDRAEAQKARDELTEQLTAAHARVEAVEKRLAVLEAAAKPQRALIDKLKAELTRKDTARAQAIASLTAQKDKQIAALQKDLDNLISEREQLTQRVKELEAALKAAQAQAAQAGALRKQLAELNAQAAKVRNELKTATQHIAALQQKADNLAGQVNALTAENRKLKEQLEAAKAEAAKSTKTETDDAPAP